MTILDFWESNKQPCNTQPECESCARLRAVLTDVATRTPSTEELDALAEGEDEHFTNALNRVRTEVAALMCGALVGALFAARNKTGQVRQELAACLASNELADAVRATGIRMPVAVVATREMVEAAAGSFVPPPPAPMN
jgi:hypothetical protein